MKMHGDGEMLLINTLWTFSHVKASLLHSNIHEFSMKVPYCLSIYLSHVNGQLHHCEDFSPQLGRTRIITITFLKYKFVSKEERSLQQQ